MRRFVGLTALAVAFLAAAGDTRAAMITYTITGTGSGTLGAASFTDQAFTVTIIADTTQVQDTGFNFAVNNLSASILLGSTDLVALAGSSYASKHPSPSFAGFYYSGSHVGDDIDAFPVGFKSPALFGYDLKTSIGPIDVTPEQSFYFETNQGLLAITPSNDLVFTATVVPEPSSLAMAASAGLAGLGCLVRRRTRRG